MGRRDRRVNRATPLRRGMKYGPERMLRVGVARPEIDEIQLAGCHRSVGVQEELVLNEIHQSVAVDVHCTDGPVQGRDRVALVSKRPAVDSLDRAVQEYLYEQGGRSADVFQHLNDIDLLVAVDISHHRRVVEAHRRSGVRLVELPSSSPANGESVQPDRRPVGLLARATLAHGATDTPIRITGDVRAVDNEIGTAVAVEVGETNLCWIVVTVRQVKRERLPGSGELWPPARARV